MCGICVCVSFREENAINSCHSSKITQDLCSRLKHRGPDYFQEILESYHSIADIHFISSILHLRGTSPALQPIKDENGNIFLWNGEIFGGLVVRKTESDTKVLSDKLFSSITHADVLHILGSIEGPFAFIFYQAKGFLWFGRDTFGRRSLLWNVDELSFRLCSIAYSNGKWNEVTTDGIFCLDLNESSSKKSFVVYFYPWFSNPSGLPVPPKSEESIEECVSVIIKPDLSLDCQITTPLNKVLPSEDVLEKFAVDADNKGKKGSELDVLTKLLTVTELKESVFQFEDVLSKSVEKRVKNHQHQCKRCRAVLNSSENCEHASVGVLFSGGLDSIVIACLADRHLSENEPIDLINVAFASRANIKSSGSEMKFSVFDTPDRITGKGGVQALRNICPNRKWNFVEVNVSEDDLISHRKNRISYLLNPSYTVLDDSIGCALWFAAHGDGIITTKDDYCSYKSQTRVLLLGMGADEQLGGYARHRGKFNSAGWQGLVEELSMELDRIGSRNLGRDDRIIADNGVESRYPFLDEKVVSFLNGLPVWVKMNLNYPRGIGEKLILRLLAFKLGLTEAAVLPKRAIQFGSRIAKIENSKEKGSDICERLKISL